MTLYELLNEIADKALEELDFDDKEKEEEKPLSKKDIEYRAKKFEKNLKKKLGNKEYKTLENYIKKNKDNEYLQELVGSTAFSVAFSNLGDFITSKDDIVVDVKLTYKLALSVYKKLKENDYDAEMAVLE